MTLDRKIKIAHIVGGLHNGGVEAVIYNHFSHLDMEKFETHIIANSPSVPECEEQFRKLGFIIHVLPERKKDFFGNLKQTISIFKENNFDIIHVHMNLFCFYHTFLGKMCGIPIRIAHAHLVEYPTNPIRIFVDGIKKRLTRMTANRYFACGKTAGEYLFGKRNVANGKVFILNNAIDVSKFLYKEETRNSLRAELGITEHCLCIGNIARFTEQKNHSFLIDIFYEISKSRADTKLLLLGKGELEPVIRDKVKKMGLDNKVLFLGVHSDIENYYQAMDVFLFPSLYEGLGIVLVEAQSSGLMCYSSDTVPKEVRLSTLVKFISLKKSAKQWADTIVSQGVNPKRNVNMKTMVEHSGYEIHQSAKRLEHFYLSCIEQ